MEQPPRSGQSPAAGGQPYPPPPAYGPPPGYGPPPPGYGPPPPYEPTGYPPPSGPPYGAYTAPGADIPAGDPRHGNQAGRPGRSGLYRWLTTGGLAGFGLWKYFALLKAVPFLYTGISLVISLSLYAWALSSWGTAIALVVMLFIHEMGHVVEIRRQGMRASAPVFIPFMGAAIFQRQMAPDAMKQAQIGIAGPIAGTLGATLAFVGFGLTHNPLFLIAAFWGFFLNIFNLIPAGMLDGGWILAPVSRWFQVAGLTFLGLLVAGPFILNVAGGLLGIVAWQEVGAIINPIVLVVVLFGLPATLHRFRNADTPYYSSVPVGARWAMGGAWLGLVVYLAIALVQTQSLLTGYVRL